MVIFKLLESQYQELLHQFNPQVLILVDLFITWSQAQQLFQVPNPTFWYLPLLLDFVPVRVFFRLLSLSFCCSRRIFSLDQGNGGSLRSRLNFFLQSSRT
jgi:hypothetical protein